MRDGEEGGGGWRAERERDVLPPDFFMIDVAEIEMEREREARVFPFVR
jgi:hypothetical protein